MPRAELCTCGYKDCPHHPSKHGHECTPCIEKNLKNHEIPACFWNKIGAEAEDGSKSEYSFHKFAEKVMAGEAETNA